MGRQQHTEQSLVLKIFALLTEAGKPLTLRQISCRFSMSNRATVEKFCTDAVKFGTLVAHGTGVKGSPRTVSIRPDDRVTTNASQA